VSFSGLFLSEKETSRDFHTEGRGWLGLKPLALVLNLSSHARTNFTTRSSPEEAVGKCEGIKPAIAAHSVLTGTTQDTEHSV